MKYLYIQVDTRDADYVAELHKIDEETLDKFLPLIEAIKQFKPYEGGGNIHEYNWPWGEHRPRTDRGEKFPKDIYSEIDPDIVSWFGEYVPMDSHTITEIAILEVSDYKRLI